MARAKIIFVVPKRPQCEAKNLMAEGYGQGQRCQNFAKYEIHHENYCGRHAGREALNILLEEEEE